MKKLIVLLKIILPIAGFGLWWHLMSNEPVRFGGQEIPTEKSWGVIAYGFLITLVGVFLGSGYRELQRQKESGKTNIVISEFFRNIFTSIDLWMGLFGAPIVYALLWKSIGDSSIAGLSVIALQNGFCCTLIASNLINGKPQSL